MDLLIFLYFEVMLLWGNVPPYQILSSSTPNLVVLVISPGFSVSLGRHVQPPVPFPPASAGSLCLHPPAWTGDLAQRGRHRATTLSHT